MAIEYAIYTATDKPDKIFSRKPEDLIT